jgi:hypothetical protein
MVSDRGRRETGDGRRERNRPTAPVWREGVGSSLVSRLPSPVSLLPAVYGTNASFRGIISSRIAR